MQSFSYKVLPSVADTVNLTPFGELIVYVTDREIQTIFML